MISVSGWPGESVFLREAEIEHDVERILLKPFGIQTVFDGIGVWLGMVALNRL